MLKEYLDDILEGKRTFDARSFDTSHRGLIGLVDISKKKIIGTIELVGTHTLTEYEYFRWHAMGKTNLSHYDLQNLDNVLKLYFAYDFKNPKRLAFPVNVKQNTLHQTWIEVDDSIQEEFFFQDYLF